MGEFFIKDTSSQFRKGLQSGISIGIGYFPIAITFGLLAKTTGLTIGETFLMSMIVYAGASQYIALNLISLGTGAFEIILTTFIVNIRHFLLCTVLNEKSEANEKTFLKVLYSFGVTDETFSVAAVKEGNVTYRYMLGLNLIAYFSWVICSGLGYMIGGNLPQMLQESMSVALYAMFIGLLVPSMKKSMKVLFLAVLGASFNTIITVRELLSTGWAIVVATLLSAMIVESIEWFKQKKGDIHA